MNRDLMPQDEFGPGDTGPPERGMRPGAAPSPPIAESRADGQAHRRSGDGIAEPGFIGVDVRGGVAGSAALGSVQQMGGDYTFEVLHAREAFEVGLLRGVDALIINTETVDAPLDIVRTIRAHSDRAIYLKPIFLLSTEPGADIVLEPLIDGFVYSLERLEKAAAVVKGVLKKEDEFGLHHSVSFEDNVITKVLRFLVSRGRRSIEPIHSRFSKIGVSYPIVDVNYQYENEHNGLRVLDAAEDDNLLVGEFVDTWYVCSTCSESRIHLREVCPECGTSDVTEEELIHHFRCAYVGPVSDFDAGAGNLSCPKCGHNLNHVGVDYDKPSSIFTCRNGHTSQNPGLNARCFTCGTETRAERLTKRVIKRYALTPTGAEKALTGVLANVRSLNEIEGVIDYSTFETMLQYEMHRVRATEVASSLAVVHFGNASELFSFLGRDARNAMLSALVDLVRAQLRSWDVLSFNNFSTLFCLAPSSSPDEVRERLQTVVHAYRSRISESFEGYVAHVVAGARAIRPEDTADDLLKSLVSSSVDALVTEFSDYD